MCGKDMIGDNFCFKGHDLAVHRFFNCVCKNLVRQLQRTITHRVSNPNDAR